jgi:hypothetical protein
LNFRKDCIVFIIICFFNSLADAQRVSKEKAEIKHPTGWYVGITPSALITLTPNLQFSTSYKFHTPIEINLEFGGLRIWRNEIKLTKWVIRPEVMIYPFKEIFYLSIGYYGVYFKGVSDRFYRHESLVFEQKFELTKYNYQNYAVGGGGFQFKIDESIYVKFGGRIGVGQRRVTGDPIPEGFEPLPSRFILFDTLIYSEDVGTNSYGFMHYYLNVSYRL